ncbi:MAG: leucine-rich repeat protein [Bacteroidales bacterium]|nr:leucine-rich repeat protein [Bacteroidales bacterium]
MKQKLTTLVLALLAGISAWAHDFEVDGIYYVITSSTDLTVSVSYRGSSDSYYSNEYSGAVVIPESVTYSGKTYSVTSINSGAFRGCSGLTSVVIPSSVTAIYTGAFRGCSGLTSVVIPSRVTAIDDNTFYGCSGLTSVTIPSSVTSIGSYAFYGCSGLTSVVIPSRVTAIGERAFYNVTKAFFLTNTKLSIGSSAFSNCKVYYTVNNGSYYGVSGTHKVYSLLSSMFEVDGVKYIPTSMSQRTCDMVDVDYAAETVNSAIGPTVKYTNSTGIQYDFKVNNVNMYAAYGCKALSDLVLKNEGEIEKYAFYNSSATAIDVDNSVTTIGDYAFSGCTSATAITASNNGTIGGSAFKGCGGATNIKLGDKITSIGGSCFYGCSSVENIKFGKKITSVGNSCFCYCSSMTSVELNDALTSIGSYAFENCSKLASLTIPANVTSIASGAFDNCTSIGDLTFEDSETAISLACRFPSVKNIYMGRNVTYSMSKFSPFSSNNNLETVMTSLNVTTIPDYAFYNCKSLKDVYLSDGVKTIGTYVFSGDIALANFEVGISVESIGAEAFSDCTALWDFKSHSILPAAVGTEALDDIDKLECTLHVPEGTKSDYEAADQWKEFRIEDDLLPRYKVTATVDPECAGMGTVKGSNGYDKNSTATLEAVPAENYLFVEWSDGNKQNPRTMTVTEAVNLTAKFAYRYYIKTQPAANNISVALSEMVSGVEYKWYVSETEGGVKDITNDLQSTGSYAWSKSGGVWTSGNKGVNNSSSTLSMDITAKAGDKLTFDYSVSSESGCDLLKIYLGNSQIGSSYSGSASGKFDYTFSSDMNTTLKFVYSKDGSVNNGSDQATISNVIIENVATLLDGETSSAVTASGLETEMYYYCEVIMPDGTILTSDKVQYTGTAGSTYTISIASSDNGMVLGAGTYVAGTTITIEAIAADGYEFVRWSDGNTDNPRVITVDANMNLTAKFAYRYYIKTQPAANNISVALSEMVSGVEYKWYVSESEGGAKDITNDLQSTGSYVWSKSGGVWTSGNNGVHSSSSTLSMDITAKAGDKLTFDYSVSSESGYDYLTIYLGNNQIGSSYSGSASGKFEYTFESDMNTTLKFVYSKDGSQNDGSDQATISNVIIGAAATLLEGETSSAVTASGLETEMYYYCEVVMPDGTVLTSDKVQYEGGQPTAIEQIGVDEKRGREGIYDIMGRKLSVPQRGINIINGKKVIVR